MACVEPPELSMQQLLAALAGEADSATSAHLSRCSTCQQQALRLAQLHHGLTMQLYRRDCPDPQLLGEYQLSMLPQAQAHLIQRHLTICPHCSAEHVRLQSYLAELRPDLEPTFPQQVRTIVATLLRGGSPMPAPSSLSLAPLGVRGELNEPLIYQADTIQIVWDITPTPAAPTTRDLLGLITGPATVGMEVVVQQGASIAAQGVVDEIGNVVLSGLQPGTYQINLRNDTLLIELPPIELH